MGELLNSRGKYNKLSFLYEDTPVDFSKKLAFFNDAVRCYQAHIESDLSVATLSFDQLHIDLESGSVSIDFTPIYDKQYPFMPPEEAGYIDWPIDLRSGLYSLGALGFALFTGKAPMFAEDGTLILDFGWDVPSMVKLILEKLLSWYPDDRYQTLQGLLHDIDVCMRQKDGEGNIPPFILGRMDVSPKIHFGQYLYGREPDTELVQLLMKKSMDAHTQLLFLGGYSGVGKTSLIKKTVYQYSDREGLYLSGKCDQYTSQPYSAFLESLRMLVGILQSDIRQPWGELLSDWMAPNGQILIDFLPEFESIMGPQESVPRVVGDNIKSRLQYVVVRLIQFLCEHFGHLTLFLDDVQWTDVSTMDVISELVKFELPLFIVCAYRDNECMTPHVIKTFRRTFSGYIDLFTDHHLSSLSKISIESMVSDVFQDRASDLGELTHLIYQKAKGNPFYTKQMIYSLVDSGRIYLSPDDQQWRWDFADLQCEEFSQNVADLMGHRIAILDDELQLVLSWASLLGTHFSLDDVNCICDRTRDEIEIELWRGVNKEFIAQMPGQTTYKFLHDNIRKGFYQLIPDEEHSDRYLHLARKLYEEWEVSSQDAVVPYRIVDYYNKGLSSICEKEELGRLVWLNKARADYALSNAAFHDAVMSYELIINLLDVHPDIMNGDELLDVYKGLIEAKYICGDYETANALVDKVLARSTSVMLSTEVLSIREAAYKAVNQYDKSISSAKIALELLGEPFPALSIKRIAYEYVKLRFNLLLFSKRLSSHLHISRNDQKNVVMRLMIDLGISAWFSGHSRLVEYVTLRGFNRVFSEGMSGESIFILTAYAMHQVHSGKIELACKYYDLALKVAADVKSRYWLSRAKEVHGTFIAYWLHAYETCVTILQGVIQSCREMGDYSFLVYSVVGKLSYYLKMGAPMDVIEKEVSSVFLPQGEEGGHVEAYYSHGTYENILFFKDFVACMRSGLTVSEYVLKDQQLFDPLDSTQFNSYCSKFLAATLYYVFGEDDQGDRVVSAFDGYIKDFRAGSFVVDFYLYRGLFAAKAARRQNSWTHRRRLKRSIDAFKEWEARNPANFESPRLLLVAEQACLTGRPSKALEAYNATIIAADQQSFNHIAAYACERAYELCLDHVELYDKASYYLKQAIHFYDTWGASAKVHQLKKIL